jgi:hypothetical protein
VRRLRPSTPELTSEVTQPLPRSCHASTNRLSGAVDVLSVSNAIYSLDLIRSSGTPLRPPDQTPSRHRPSPPARLPPAAGPDDEIHQAARHLRRYSSRSSLPEHCSPHPRKASRERKPLLRQVELDCGTANRVHRSGCGRCTQCQRPFGSRTPGETLNGMRATAARRAKRRKVCRRHSPRPGRPLGRDRPHGDPDADRRQRLEDQPGACAPRSDHRRPRRGRAWTRPNWHAAATRWSPARLGARSGGKVAGKPDISPAPTGQEVPIVSCPRVLSSCLVIVSCHAAGRCLRSPPSR